MSRKLSRNSRRAVVASLLGLTVGGGVLASAASLGVTGNTLGAGTVVIASCDTDGVTLKYGHTYVPTVVTPGNPGAYRTSSVTISGINVACVGKALDITLKDTAGAALGSGNVAAIVATAPATATNNVVVVTFTTPFIDATAVTGAAVVIAD
jgi:hypothetical protein